MNRNLMKNHVIDPTMLGWLDLHYHCALPVDLGLIHQEFESGACFALYPDREDVVCSSLNFSQNIQIKPSRDGFTISVSQAFLPPSSRFTRLTTSFLLNLLDFGPIRLEHITFKTPEPNTGTIAHGSTPIPYAAFGTVVKPYFLLDHSERVDLIVRFAECGFDLVKEDECHLIEPDAALATVCGVRRRTPDSFCYIPNVTAFAHDISAVQELYDAGCKCVMVNGLVVGLQAIYTLTSKVPGLFVWMHRVGYEAMRGVLSVQALTQLSVLAGAQMIHIGTPVTQAEIQTRRRFAPQAFDGSGSFRPVFTKLTPSILEPLAEAFGAAGIYMTCGAIRDPIDGKLCPSRMASWRKCADTVRAAHR